MKNILVLFVLLFCVQLGANAQTSKEAIPQNIITNLSKQIKQDLPNRSKILSEAKALNGILKEKFGEDLDISADNVVSYLLISVSDNTIPVELRKSAMKVLYGFTRKSTGEKEY